MHSNFVRVQVYGERTAAWKVEAEEEENEEDEEDEEEARPRWELTATGAMKHFRAALVIQYDDDADNENDEEEDDVTGTESRLARRFSNDPRGCLLLLRETAA